MTALATELPRFTDGDFWTVAYEGCRRVAEMETNEQITEADADRRITVYARKDLTVEARNDAYEQLKDALARLSCLQMPGGCPCHDWSNVDVQSAELDADSDAHNAIKRLIGERPVKR
jgi:hypothetical protein